MLREGFGSRRQLQSSDPKSLKDSAGKLQGRHLLSDGRPLMVTVEYLTPDQINAGHLIYPRERKTPQFRAGI
jgi:hypothetical protein